MIPPYYAQDTLILRLYAKHTPDLKVISLAFKPWNIRTSHPCNTCKVTSICTCNEQVGSSYFYDIILFSKLPSPCILTNLRKSIKNVLLKTIDLTWLFGHPFMYKRINNNRKKTYCASNLFFNHMVRIQNLNQHKAFYNVNYMCIDSQNCHQLLESKYQYWDAKVWLLFFCAIFKFQLLKSWTKILSLKPSLV